MILTRQRLSASRAATAVSIIVLSVLITPTSSVAAAQTTVPIVECEIDGFGLGDSVDQARKIFGEPQQDSVVKPLLNEYPNREHKYDGIRIVFSTNGRSALSFYVTSPVYRLRSGIGIGSTWSEVVQALGPGSFSISNGLTTYSYHVVNSNGDYVPAWLRLSLKNEVVTGLSVVTTQ